MSAAFSETEIGTSFEQGTALYEKEDYYSAKDIFEKLVALEPKNSDLHHWLGKCYGRIAETASWIKAMSMAKKTRKAFEKAVALDEKNIDALEDLMQYYLEAPGFLGGSKKKANEIEKRLNQIGNNI
ncbi:MAG: tetratricopeptide repeat protein [Gammaproteobacteria bacterium]